MVLRADAEAARAFTAPAGVVIVGAASADIRRSVGPAVWCALEVLAASPPADDGDAWIVGSSVRTLAGRIGVAKNTAHRALVVLRGARLVDLIQRRSATSEYGSCACRQSQTSPAASSQAVEPRRVLPKALEVAQQLVLFRSV